VRCGGTLVSVNVSDEQAASVEAVLDRFERVELGRRREAYLSTGWTHFDEQAAVYSPMKRPPNAKAGHFGRRSTEVIHPFPSR